MAGIGLIAIRQYVSADAEFLRLIFFNTVRRVNSRDYNQTQIIAWAPTKHDTAAWAARMTNIRPFVAELDDEVVGYADLQPDGFIDHFFCHHAHQGEGVGRALMEHIFRVGAQRGVVRYYAHVSITARPFFERFGFRVVRQQQVVLRGVALTNYLMERIAAD